MFKQTVAFQNKFLFFKRHLLALYANYAKFITHRFTLRAEQKQSKFFSLFAQFTAGQTDYDADSSHTHGRQTHTAAHLKHPEMPGQKMRIDNGCCTYVHEPGAALAAF